MYRTDATLTYHHWVHRSLNLELCVIRDNGVISQFLCLFLIINAPNSKMTYALHRFGEYYHFLIIFFFLQEY